MKASNIHGEIVCCRMIWFVDCILIMPSNQARLITAKYMNAAENAKWHTHVLPWYLQGTNPNIKRDIISYTMAVLPAVSYDPLRTKRSGYLPGRYALGTDDRPWRNTAVVEENFNRMCGTTICIWMSYSIAFSARSSGTEDRHMPIAAKTAVQSGKPVVDVVSVPFVMHDVALMIWQSWRKCPIMRLLGSWMRNEWCHLRTFRQDYWDSGWWFMRYLLDDFTGAVLKNVGMELGANDSESDSLWIVCWLCYHLIRSTATRRV